MNEFLLRAADLGISTPDDKRAFNRLHFSESSSRYDLATVAMSLGRDAAWKRCLIGLLPDLQAPHCLDIACGTGDLTAALARRYPDGVIEGLDLTSPMLKVAERRNRHANVRYILGDMQSLPYADESIDVLTGGYAIRNAPELPRALKEIRRVLKSGGLAAFLDFSKPRCRSLQFLQYWLLRLWCGLWGFLLHGTTKVHGYISLSLKGYPDQEELRALFEQHNLTLLERRTFFLGITEVFLVQKASD